jgi:hypothetical protein
MCSRARSLAYSVIVIVIVAEASGAPGEGAPLGCRQFLIEVGQGLSLHPARVLIGYVCDGDERELARLRRM